MGRENVILTKDKSEANGQFMTYDVTNKAEANGNVKIILSNKSVIYADNVKADFTSKDKSLKKAVAKGNVIIENRVKGRKSKADVGIYNSSDEIVRLSGNVTIINQSSKISGSKGITNLKTGISNIIGDP